MLTLTIDELMAETFAERLAEAMQGAGINAASLAAAVGVSPSAVSQWLSASTKNMRPEHLFAAADVLGVEARWLATGRGPRERNAFADLPAELIEALKKHLR